MRSNILTILPHPNERLPGGRAALPAAGSAQHDDSGVRSAETLPSIESILLQRLLAELDSRGIAKAQPTYVIEQQPPARNASVVRALWSAIWALSLVVCVLFVKYLDNQTMIPRPETAATHDFENLTATVSDQRKEFSAMTQALQQLAGSIASNSAREPSIPDLLARLRADLQPRAPIARTPLEPAQTQPLQPPSESIAAPQASELSLIPLGGHHHPPLEYATVAPAEAIVHHNAAGVMDYWLVPRVVSGVQAMVKVVPISQNNTGTLVHDVAEVKDYLLTPAGDWVPVPEANGNE